MARKLIKRYLPDASTIRNHKQLKIFGSLLHDPNLLHINRYSASRACAIGLFMAFMPIPFQMIPAAFFAILFRANLLISLALVWISNPLTIPPIFYFCYKVGAWILQTPPQAFDFEMTREWLTEGIIAVWQPLLLGCFTVSLICSMLGFISMRGFWRWHVIREWELRKEKRRAARQR